MNDNEDPYSSEDMSANGESCSSPLQDNLDDVQGHVSFPQKSLQSKKKPSCLLSGRGVTTQMLIDDQILEPGEKCLTISYLGRKFVADLQDDGVIFCHDERQVFSSPSAWAMHCKRQVNPEKKSGCGWASVRYKGRKLDEFKSKWFQKQRLERAVAASSVNDLIPSADASSEEQLKRKAVESSVLQVAVAKGGRPPKLAREVSSKSRGHGRGRGKRSEMPSLYSCVSRFPSTGPEENQCFSQNSHKVLEGDKRQDVARLKFTGKVKTSLPTSGLIETSSLAPNYVPQSQKYLTFSEALRAVPPGEPATSSSRISEVQSKTSWHNLQSNKCSPPPSNRVLCERPQKTTSTYHGCIPNLSRPVVNTLCRRRNLKSQTSVKHAIVQASSDPSTLVECAQFQSIGRIQPFSITISTSASLLMDFHCHLSTSEVMGYLGGKWDSSRQHIRITVACPCLYPSSEQTDINQTESKIRETMEAQDLVLVGWYHSHPYCPADPTLADIKSQLMYQQLLEDGHYQPCVGLIISPFDSCKKESQFRAFWVREPCGVSVNQVPLPLGMNYTTHQNQQLTQDVIDDMVSLVNWYKSSPDSIVFTDMWATDLPYVEKIKHSLIRKFPQDQTDGRFLDFIHKLLMASSD